MPPSRQPPAVTLVGPVVFGPFRLDPSAGGLFEGERSVPLRRRTWDVLCHLVARAGELVPKEELLASVWRDAMVSEPTLSTSIAELRRALGDDPRRPRFIETVHRRGFRFVARVAPASSPESASPPGRAREMDALLGWWREADGGRRRIGFVTGEAGMGKTTLVRAFVERVREERVRVATGACIEHHGEGEAFMPVLDAVRRLARGPAGAEVAGRIRASAPRWLVDLLGALEPGDPAASTVEPPSTRVQTLRCLAETLEALAADGPLVVVLEDVHWSDGSTVDLLNLLGRRGDPARLLVLATLRPADARSVGHPVAELVRSLSRQPGCAAVELPGLPVAAAAGLLAECLGDADVPVDLAGDLAERTGGNPFFLREMALHLARVGALSRRDGAWRLRDRAAAAAPPEGVLALLEPRIARLEERERKVLEPAAVVGERFSPRLVAEALGGTVEEDAVDAICSGLAARSEFVTRSEGDTWRFVHALNTAALRRRIPAARRRRLHERVGRALERSGRASPALLASHFAQAGSPERAALYYEEGVRVAKQSFAAREVALLCAAALECLAALPSDRERSERELRLQLERGAATLATRGYSAPEQAAIFGRVCELADALGQPAVRFVGAGGLFFHHLSSGNVPAGRAAAECMLELAERLPEPMRDAARTGMGVVLFNAGELGEALPFLEREGLEPPAPDIVQVDVPVFRLGALAKTLAHLGHPARARATIDACVARGGSGGRPFDLANGHRMAAELHAILDDVEAVRAHAERAIAISDAHGFAQLLAVARLFEGWARAHASEAADDAARGLETISEALAALEPTGYRLTLSAFRLRQAEAALRAGAPEAAERAVEAGLAYVAESGERRHESDLLRLRGRSRLLRGAGPGAEEAADLALRSACEVARAQGAVLPELRALVERAALPDRGAEAVASLRRRLAELPGALPARELEAARRRVV